MLKIKPKEINEYFFSAAKQGGGSRGRKGKKI